MPHATPMEQIGGSSNPQAQHPPTDPTPIIIAERFLPPVGCFYDEPTLDKLFGKAFFQDHRKCTSCWKVFQTDGNGRDIGGHRDGKCNQSCAVCGSSAHLGQVNIYKQKDSWPEIELPRTRISLVEIPC